jgi:hypothetical protein
VKRLAALAVVAAACGSAETAGPPPSAPVPWPAERSSLAGQVPDAPRTSAQLAPAQLEALPAVLASPQAQDNDLAVLVPLETAALTPEAPGAGGPLVPAELYARAFGPPGALQRGGTPAAPALAGLRMVAFRLDPCAPAATAGAPCTAQLRLVFQTVTTSAGHPAAADDAVHAFYALERDQLLGAVRAIIALRRREAGDRELGALAPHPLLVEQGRGEFATALEALVCSLAGPRNLVRLTEITSSGMGTAWNFAGVDLAGGAATPVAIPGLPAGAPMISFFAGFSPGELTGQPAVTPAPQLAAGDDVQRLATRDRVAARIEDPAIHTSATIDCVSCHVARSLCNPARSVGVHMFAYQGTTPSIQPRARREIAASLDLVNALLAAR